MSRYVNNNGQLISAEGYSIEAGNRGHLYGDGLFESIRVFDGHPINLEQHLNRLFEGMKALKMNQPDSFSLAFFEREIQTLLTRNEIQHGARLRLSIDRAKGGTYLPASNHVDYFIEVYPHQQNKFELNKMGLKIDLYDEMKKSINQLSPYKTKNCLTYIMARIKAGETGMDDLLIMNEKQGIIEASSSNLFIVSNGVLYTPGIDSGCLGGTMRMQIINLAIRERIKVYECNISPQYLLSADEVFLSNAIQGVLWVQSFRSKTYTHAVSQEMVQLLNQEWKTK
jgi:branched-chain amino acid aminotransferase